MVLKPKYACLVPIIALLVPILFVCGCNRAALRAPGASLAFPERLTAYSAKTASYPYALVVTAPIDQRSKHYGEDVAGTKWKSCSNDPFWSTNASEIIQQRLVKELQASRLFSKVSTTPTSPDDVMMKTEIHAFCSQARGFISVRVAGITSLHITLEQNGKILSDHKFEKVVTDADKEYTGAQVATVEQAMSVTMADSLRESLKDMLKQIDAEAGAWRVV